MVEQCITKLSHLRKTFERANLTNELLCSRVIVSIQDTRLVESMMFDLSMDLNKVMLTVRRILHQDKVCSPMLFLLPGMTSVLYGQRRAGQDGEARSDNQGHPVNTLVC